MNIDWNGAEIPAYIEMDKLDITGLIQEVFDIFYVFADVSCITLEVYPRYNPKPTNLQECMEELCLRGKIKRGTYLVEIK